MTVDLERAKAGDERAFASLVEPFRRELQLHCYRLLGSVQDAEDLVQETLLAAWRGLDGFEERASLRSWLYRIATNRSLNAIRERGRRPATENTMRPSKTRRAVEPSWLEPYPDSALPDPAPGPEARYEQREAIQLMASLVFLPIADEIESGTYLIYDGACGTGGMLTVAEDTLLDLASEHGKDVSIHLYGQEINNETYAICKADLLLKGEGEAADNIVGGPEHSTLSNDAFPSREFDFMLSNPPYGKSWKSDLERMGGKRGIKDSRFIVEHAGAER